MSFQNLSSDMSVDMSVDKSADAFADALCIIILAYSYTKFGSAQPKLVLCIPISSNDFHLYGHFSIPSLMEVFF